jgi:toll-like receptor 13
VENMSNEDIKDENFRVFISHAAEDLREAKHIARWCKDIGLSILINEEEIKVGEKWREKIADAIEKSEVIIVLVSKDALKSKWCSREWDVLCEKKWSRPDKSILLIKWENVKSPPFLCNYKGLNIKKNESDYELLKEHITQLLKDRYGETSTVVSSEVSTEEVKRLKDRIKSIKSSLMKVEDDEQGGHSDDQT